MSTSNFQQLRELISEISSYTSEDINYIILQLHKEADRLACLYGESNESIPANKTTTEAKSK